MVMEKYLSQDNELPFYGKSDHEIPFLAERT